MRGLSIRVEYASAKLRLAIEPADIDAEDELHSCLYQAEAMGVHEYPAESAPPTLFFDEPGLLRAWHSGYDFSEDLDIMRACPTCQSSAPCPFHG